MITLGPGFYQSAVLQSELVENDFQTWHMTGWHHEPPASQKEFLLTNMDFNTDYNIAFT